MLLLKACSSSLAARPRSITSAKGRHGAFWEDRYHATAIEANEHLHRCLVYIDLNMVRAGAVSHPVDWEHSGYREIQEPPKRYAIIGLKGLSDLCGFGEVGEFRRAHREWFQNALKNGPTTRDDRWSESIAVGSLDFVEKVKSDLGMKATHREFEPVGDAYALRESGEAYGRGFTGQNDSLRPENTFPWDPKAASSASLASAVRPRCAVRRAVPGTVSIPVWSGGNSGNTRSGERWLKKQHRLRRVGPAQSIDLGKERCKIGAI
jgi:hypothetical protein